MIRFVAPALVAWSMIGSPAMSGEIANLSDDDRLAFRAEVRAYLMDNPEVIIEAVELLKQRDAQQQAQTDFSLVSANVDELFDDGYSWVGGNPDGDITLVEFLDYRCGYCRRAMPEVMNLLKSDGNIRLIVKEFPILGDASMVSSRFAIATKHVAGGDAYKQVHDALMEFSGDPTEVALRRLAEGLGLEADAILGAMDSDAVSHEIARTRALAQRLEITGTPTFVVQDELLRGFLPGDQMAAMIAEKRSR